MFNQILLSPQVKRSANITYKHCIYQLHELPNNFRLKILRNLERSINCLNLINDSLVPNLLAKIKILPILGRNSSKTGLNFSFKNVHYFPCKLELI